MTDPNPHTEDWLLFKATGDLEARGRLVVGYTPLVRYVAGRVAVGLPQNVEQADLVSYGIFGLIDAIEKFDPDRGFKFETYAIARIKGAILDELRSIDWVPRSVRGKHRAVEVATRKLEGELRRHPTENELARELEIDVKQLRDIIASTTTVMVGPFEDDSGGEDTSVADVLADSPTTIDDDLSSAEDIERIRRSLVSAAVELSEREQFVLGLYYSQGLTLAEIGQVLGVTESRVCQIHTRAVLQLRERIIASEMEPA